MAATVTKLRTRRPTGQASWPLILLSGEAKTGKAQPLHARLATPTGWTTMGDVAVGDQLIGSDGGPITVLAVYERGELPIYRLTFSDGSAAEACGEHLWATWKAEERHRRWQRGDHAGQKRMLPAKVRTTEEIRELLVNMKDRSGHRTVFIPMAAPVRYAPQSEPLPVDPYVLGLLLGDGGLSKPNYPSFTSVDAELFAAIENRLPYGDYFTRIHGKPTVMIGGGHLVLALRGLGLMELKSENKHIPDQYLTATVGERLALLQGLMDTDGTLTRRGTSATGASMFSTSSTRLANDVRQLVESLGGTAATRTKVTTHLPSHEMNIRLRKGMCPFRLSRKVKAFDETRPRAHCPPKRTVKQVDFVGTMPARCIAVDAEDHLYLTDNFIVTHNTYAAAQFTGDERVGQAYWLDLGEGCADEYGSVPGADYLVIEHNGTWVEIVEAAEAVKEIAKQELAAGNPPVVLVIDSMTAEWAMLTEWTHTRAKNSRKNKTMLSADPDAEIDVGPNYWNDANSRHNRLMNILKTFPGIVIMTTLETEKTQIGPGGAPLANAPKVAKPDAQKRLPADATLWIRLSLTEPATIVGVRSVRVNIRPGHDKPKPLSDFDLGDLVFDKMGLKSGATVRDVPMLDANQVAPGEEITEPHEQPQRAVNRQQRPAQPTWEEKIANCGTNLDTLKDLYKFAPDDIKEKIVKRVKEIDPHALERKAKAKAEPQPEVVDAEIVEESPKAPSIQDVVDNLITCSSFDEAESVRKRGQSDDVAAFIDEQVREVLNIPADASVVRLDKLASAVATYIKKHGYSVDHGIDLASGVAA